MTTIPGASQYLNASTLAASRGIAAQGTNLLGSVAGSVSVLDAGRSGLLNNGIGLSSNARQLNKQFLENNNGNQLFSAGLGATASVDGLMQQILALRAGMSDRQLGPDLVEYTDDGSAASSSTGSVVNQTA